MTASVGDLLTRLHSRAWQLAFADNDQGGGQQHAGSHLAAWPTFAAATIRTIQALPVVSAYRDDDLASLVTVLSPVAQGSGSWQDLSGGAGARRPQPDLMDMALVIGAIADLLAGRGAAYGEADERAALGLRANLLAPVHTAAMSTLTVLDDHQGIESARDQLRRVVAITGPYLLVPSSERVGRYEDIAAVRADEPTLDGAIYRWLHATRESLTPRRGVSGIGLQTAASDLAILTAAAAVATAAVIKQGGLSDRAGQPAIEALQAAHLAWKDPARWPTYVRLAGLRATEQTIASADLRDAVGRALREGSGWATAGEITRRNDPQHLLATLRRAMASATVVAQLHHQAITNLVHGRNQLWIAAAAVTDPVFSSARLLTARSHSQWVLMPREEPTGLAMHRLSKHAKDTTQAARVALETTTTPAAPNAARVTRRLHLAEGRLEVLPEPTLWETPRRSVAGLKRERRTRPKPAAPGCGLAP